MALVEDQKQQAEPVLDQEDTSAANLEAISAAVAAVGVAMADLSSASANPDQWDVIKAAADAPAIEAEKAAAKEALEKENVAKVSLEISENKIADENDQEATIEKSTVDETTAEVPTIEKKDTKYVENSEIDVNEKNEQEAPIEKSTEDENHEEIQSVEKQDESLSGKESVVVEQPLASTEETAPEAPAEEPSFVIPSEDSIVNVEEDSAANQDGELTEVQFDDQSEQENSNSDIVENEDCQDQYSDYLGGDQDEMSLDSISVSDTSSQKIKKQGRVMGGFRSIGKGLKDITVGSGRQVTKTTKKAANVGSNTISKGADGVANAARSAATGTASGVKAVASGIRDTGTGFAKATAGSISDIGTVSSKVATEAKDAVVQGTCIGVGLAVLGVEAVGGGAKRTAVAITDGTVGVATSVAQGVKTAGGAVVSGAASAVHSVSETIEEAVDATKSGIRAVEQGIENAAMKSAAAVRQNTVAALTMGLKMADSNLQVVPKAIEAKPPSESN